jgi:hypothetical protein
MRPARRIARFFLIGLVTAACNRSAGGQPPADLSMTAVASTLVAASAQPPTPRFPTWTPPPSATPLVSPSPTPPSTATPGPSPTASPFPLPPGDPRTGLNLAAPDYIDDFSNPLTWVGPSFEGASSEILDGRLHAVDRLADGYLWWSTTLPDLEASNVYIEVGAITEACAGKDAYGLAARVGGYGLNSGYTLEFSCDGHYRIREFLGGTVSLIRDWTLAPAIRPGPNTVNRLGFLLRAGSLSAVANGEVIGQVEDFDLSYGNYGLFAHAEASAPAGVFFDDFHLWYLLP